jgi:hypothetical protein
VGFSVTIADRLEMDIFCSAAMPAHSDHAGVLRRDHRQPTYVGIGPVRRTFPLKIAEVLA